MRKNIHHPIYFHGLNLKNALVRSATNEHMATIYDTPSDKLILFYEELAKHVGLLITGFCFPTPEEIVTNKMLGLYQDEQLPQYQRLCDAVHQQNAKILLQIVAGGNFKEKAPHAYTVEEIHHLPTLFAQCAKRAQGAGFDGIQLHFAHGYVLSQFLSPDKNLRHDAYGGSLENRSRLPLEILKEVRRQVPDVHISAKLHCDDFRENGFHLQESITFAKQLALYGLDSLEISGGNCTTLKQEGFYSEEANKIASTISIPVYCVGGYTNMDAINDAYNTTKIAAFSMSRALSNRFDFCDYEHAQSSCVKCGKCYSFHAPCVQQLPKRTIFASDFDGTLTTDHHTIAAHTIQAIQSYALDNVFGIVSGRDPLSLLHCCKEAHLPYDFLICFNGALCIDLHDACIYDSPITNALDSVLEYLAESDAYSYHILGYHKAILQYTDHVSKESIAFEEHQFKDYTLVQDIAQIEKVYMITCEFMNDESALQAVIYINQTFPHISASANTNFIDIMNQGVSKANGVQQMINYFHGSKDHTYVIGDSYNDIEMLKQFSSFAIKGNPHVEAHANWIVHDVEEALHKLPKHSE